LLAVSGAGIEPAFWPKCLPGNLAALAKADGCPTTRSFLSCSIAAFFVSGRLQISRVMNAVVISDMHCFLATEESGAE
jgi:hypothetical protein